MSKKNILFVFFFLSFMCNAQTKIIGHRGYSYIAPENTMSSAKLAWKSNADGVETDIYLTKDNKIICSHDPSTKRTSGRDYKIPETDSKILRKLDVGSFKDPKYKGEKMPFLKEFVKAVPSGKELVVEIKCGTEVLPYLKETIEKYGKHKIISFICFSLPVITETKKTFPGNKCYWLCDNKNLLDNSLAAIPATGIDGISLGWNIIDEDVMKKASGLNLEVYSWTVDKPEEAKRLISLGVKGITTNRPGWLREQIAN